MARRDEEAEQRGPLALLFDIFNACKKILLTPFRIVTSKFALRAYVASILFASTAFVLLFFAIVAYTLFYWSYIPRIGFERTFHLQFDPIPPECAVLSSGQLSSALSTASKCAPSYPWGIVNLAPDLASVQRYDIKAILTMPRTPQNTEMGNFMLDAKMFAPGDKGTTVDSLKKGLIIEDTASYRILAHARRPAILTYYSPPVDLAQKAAQLHWYLLGWRQEAETLTIDLFDEVEFAKGWRNVPSTLRLELQSAQRSQIQIYDAKVIFRARFAGLRWIMYNHRIISAVTFIISFWVTEVVFTAIAWLVLGVFIFGGAKQVEGKKDDESEDSGVKEEDAMMSDTERTFPTYGRQPPLKYESPPVKKEEAGLDEGGLISQVPAALSAEADDEDEDADFVLDEGRWAPRSDSGLGTSMDSSAGRGPVVRRRRSKPSGSIF